MMKINFEDIYLKGRQGLTREGIFTWLRFLFVYLECSRESLQGRRLLDVACGDGSFLLWASRETSYVGSDINLQKLLEAKREHPFLELVLADAANLPFRAEAFNVAVTSETLEHLADNKRQEAIREIARVTCNRLIVTVPTVSLFCFFGTVLHNLLQRLGWVKERHKIGFKSSEHYTEFFRIPFDDIVELNYLVRTLRGHGFVELLCQEIGFLTYLIFPLSRKSLIRPVLHPWLTVLIMKLEKTFARVHFPFGQYAIIHFRRRPD